MALSRLLRGFGALLLLTGLAACRSDDPVELVPADLKVVRGLPDSRDFPSTDSHLPLVAFTVDWPASLRLDLNRVAEPGEVQLSFFPEPLSARLRLSGTSGIAWVDSFVPEPQTAVQRILIDGPRFERPWIWEFLVVERDRAPAAQLTARVFHHRPVPPAPSVLRSLVLVYDPAAGGEAVDARSLLDQTPVTATLARIDTSSGSGREATVVVDGLAPGLYTLAAILDTSGDGVYDPDVDWWGTAWVEGASAWLPDYQPASTDPFQAGVLEVELLPPR